MCRAREIKDTLLSVLLVFIWNIVISCSRNTLRKMLTHWSSSSPEVYEVGGQLKPGNVVVGAHEDVQLEETLRSDNYKHMFEGRTFGQRLGDFYLVS